MYLCKKAIFISHIILTYGPDAVFYYPFVVLWLKLTNVYLHFVSDLFHAEISLSVHRISGGNLDMGSISIAELDIRK